LLRDQGGAQLDAAAVREALMSANYGAFVDMYDELVNIDMGNASLWHYIARANAGEAFKYSLVRELQKRRKQAEEAGTEMEPFDPLEHRAKENRTFLHWAAAFDANEVVDFWARNWGNVGLDAIDDRNFNPAHYAYMRAITGTDTWTNGPVGNIDTKKDLLALKPPYPGQHYLKSHKPLYTFLMMRTDPNYVDPDSE
jgi:hypothetical protein